MSNTQVTHKRVKCYHTRIGLTKHKVLGRRLLVHLKNTKKKVTMSIPFCYFLTHKLISIQVINAPPLFQSTRYARQLKYGIM